MCAVPTGTLLVVSHDAAFLHEACTDLLHADGAGALSRWGADVYKFLDSKEQREAKRRKTYDHKSAHSDNRNLKKR